MGRTLHFDRGYIAYVSGSLVVERYGEGSEMKDQDILSLKCSIDISFLSSRFRVKGH